MRIQLTPSFVLTDEGAAVPCVVNLQTQQRYTRDDIVAWYPSWGMAPCWLSVQRAVSTLTLTAEQTALVQRFCNRPT